jgi:hypothetical protein
MNTNEYNKGYAEGRHVAREEIISFIYEQYYLYLRKWWGKESDVTILVKNMILDLREDQANEMEKNKEPSQDE